MRNSNYLQKLKPDFILNFRDFANSFRYVIAPILINNSESQHAVKKFLKEHLLKANRIRTTLNS